MKLEALNKKDIESFKKQLKSATFKREEHILTPTSLNFLEAMRRVFANGRVEIVKIGIKNGQRPPFHILPRIMLRILLNEKSLTSQFGPLMTSQTKIKLIGQPGGIPIAPSLNLWENLQR